MSTPGPIPKQRDEKNLGGELASVGNEPASGHSATRQQNNYVLPP